MYKSILKNILPIVIITVLYLSYYFLIILNQNIFQYADQELTLSYNGYLLNQGLAQEYTDHPALFNIILTSIVNFSQIIFFEFPNKIEVLNENIIANIKRLILASRISNLILFLSFNFFLFYFISKKINKKITCIYIIVFINTSLSIFVHTLQYRSEFFGVFLIIISFLFLSKFLESEKRSITFILLYIILFYFSLLNKTQIIFYYPFYLIIFLALSNYNNSNHVSKLVFILLLIILPFNLFYYYKISNFYSFYFNIFFYLSLNFIFYVFFVIKKIEKKSRLYFLCLFNLFFVLICFLLLQLTKHSNLLSSSLFANINNPLRMLVFTNNEISQNIDNGSFMDIILNLLKNIRYFIFEFFFSRNNIVNLMLILFFITRNYINKNLNILFVIILGIIFQIIIGSITLNRYMALHYLIYIDLITISTFLWILINDVFKYKNLLILFLIFMNLILIFLNFDFNLNTNYLQILCKNTFISDFHKKLDFEKFEASCLLY